jgi:Flp pilus assembly protein TadD
MGRSDSARLEAGWAALRTADWDTARDSFFERVKDEPEDPEALDGLGQALWWLGQRRDGIERRREAYAIYSRRGERLAAANLATYLAAEHRITGDQRARAGAPGPRSGGGGAVDRGEVDAGGQARPAPIPAEAQAGQR